MAQVTKNTLQTLVTKIKSLLGGKQDTITDLGTIRTNSGKVPTLETSIAENKKSIDQLQTSLGNLPGAFRYKGDFSTLPNVNDYVKGDVVVVENREYYASDAGGTLAWKEWGDEVNHVKKVDYESDKKTINESIQEVAEMKPLLVQYDSASGVDTDFNTILLSVLKGIPVSLLDNSPDGGGKIYFVDGSIEANISTERLTFINISYNPDSTSGDQSYYIRSVELTSSSTAANGCTCTSHEEILVGDSRVLLTEINKREQYFPEMTKEEVEALFN